MEKVIKTPIGKAYHKQAVLAGVRGVQEERALGRKKTF